MNEARNALAAARAALGLAVPAWTRPSVAARTVITAVDVTDLRNGVK